MRNLSAINDKTLGAWFALRASDDDVRDYTSI